MRSSDKTEISLIYANISQEDILVKAELDELAESNERFKVYYVLDKPPEGWKGGEGFVTKDMISEHCPKPDKENKILMCVYGRCAVADCQLRSASDGQSDGQEPH